MTWLQNETIQKCLIQNLKTICKEYLWVFYEEDKMFSHEGNNLTAIVSNVFGIDDEIY